MGKQSLIKTLKNMKRINLIVRGLSSCIDSLLKVKEKRILRAIDSATDYCDEKIAECEESKMNIVESMGSAETSDALSECINNYIEACEDIEKWNKTKEIIEKQLIPYLNEEVKEPKEPKKC